jgi:hypothetical protein
MKRLLLLSLAACGLKVNVNGHIQTLGGGSPPASAPAPMVATAQTKPPGPSDAPQPTANYKTATITIAQALTTTPLLASVDGVALDGNIKKIIGSYGNECTSEITTKPVAVLDVKQPSPNMHITVHGGRDDGFIIKKGSTYWVACAQTISQAPEMAPPEEGWPAGHYEVYPVARTGKQAEGHRFEVAVFDPKNQAPWSANVRVLKLAHKLDKPMLVEIPVHTDRQVRGEDFAGVHCNKAAFAFEPDISLSVDRPIPGLVIRPLATKTQVTLRLERMKDHDKSCLPFRETMTSGPSWQPENSIFMGSLGEGKFAISVGLPPGATDAKVTLMISDFSTTFDPLAQASLPGPLDLEQRIIPYHFPQLSTDKLGLGSRDAADLSAKIFASAPAAMFVYPDIDLDRDVASGGNGHDFPRKNEPLLVVGHVTNGMSVLAQDGMLFEVEESHLALAPDGTPKLLTAPRPLAKDTSISTLEDLDPDKSLGKQLDAQDAKRNACVDRVADPYERQVPVAYVGGEKITIENAHTRALADAEDSAIIRACGSRESWGKHYEAVRLQILAQVEKARIARFPAAKPHL